ncbi:DUF3955 domain-containing protein [Mesobacillus zeae]|uniref:DUF3955 domain-containing protein n=1 Tax=Mesobacillus zeae TaxID=1917180 RepID=A0A398BA47_9BACI|nr:DUF3955 domain-containing protein [Mesobacillus zeae]RID86732.1 DUF3955 domain-containing protein [Mesobacillus zeae]
MKKAMLMLVPFIISAVCLIAYNMIGSEVAPDGTLNEPFFLIPIAWLAFFAGIVSLIINTFTSRKKNV